MKYMEKASLKEKLKRKINNRRPVILAGAGCGIVAREEEAAGADIIVAYNTGIYRMDGHVSLVGYRYYSDGNEDTLALGRILSNICLLYTLTLPTICSV